MHELSLSSGPLCPTEGFQRASLTSIPAVNPSSVMSPAGSSQAEEQQYLDKLKQLSKYIEPLRRMINKIDKNEGGARAGHRGPVDALNLCLSVPSLSQTEKRT